MRSILILMSLMVGLCFSSFGQNKEVFDSKQATKTNVKINYDFEGALPVQEISVDVVDGMYIYEGDIILGEEGMENAQKDAGRPECSVRWPNGVIPYEIAANHTQKDEILKAIKMINEQTVLCVSPRDKQADYVEFVQQGWCSSYVGKIGGRQTISINGCPVGSIMHEILHAAGMWHEQSRSDRDDYIKVNTENIKDGKSHNFNKKTGTISSCYYDYGSIMHYSAYGFSKNGKPTLEPKDNLPSQIKIGQRKALSICDIEGIANLYPNTTGCGNKEEIKCDYVNGQPTVSSWGPSNLNVFLRGTDGAVMVKTWTGKKWNDWLNLEGKIPAGARIQAVSWGAGRVDLFVRGMDNALWHKWFSSGKWSGWESLGGKITSDPEVVSWGENRLDIFARGTDGAVWHHWFDRSTGGWGKWESLTGVIPTDAQITAVSWGSRRLDFFVRGMDNGLWHRAYDQNKWTKWKTLGGKITSNPVVVSWGEGRLDIFARGTKAAVWHHWFDRSTGGWGKWESLSGVIPPGSQIAAVSRGSRKLDFFVRGMDNALWHRGYDTNKWTGWTSLKGKLTSNPAGVGKGFGKAGVVARTADDKISYKFWDGSKWVNGPVL